MGSSPRSIPQRQGWLALEVDSKLSAPSPGSTDWAPNPSTSSVKSSNNWALLSHILSWLLERQQLESQIPQFSCQKGPVDHCPKPRKEARTIVQLCGPQEATHETTPGLSAHQVCFLPARMPWLSSLCGTKLWEGRGAWAGGMGRGQGQWTPSCPSTHSPGPPVS